MSVVDVQMEHDFALNAEQQRLKEDARRFSQEVIRPLVEEAEEGEYTPRAIVEEAGQQGFLGVQYPSDIGGRGAGLIGSAIVREETSYTNAGISSTLGHQDHVGTKYLTIQADASQRQRWLQPALAGEILSSWAVTEPGAGSDVRSMRTRAERASGHWRIRGSKMFITNGPSADIVQVVCRLVEEDRFGVFVVERNRPGFTSRPLKKLGLRASQVGELNFDDVLVPDENRLSPDGGVDLFEILDVLAEGRVLVAASAVGIAQAALDAALAFRQARSGATLDIGSSELRSAFAEAATLTEASRLMTYRAGLLCDASDTVPLLECSRAKLFASEASLRVVELLERAVGSVTMPLEQYVRDVRFVQIVEGTTEIQHRIIAKQLGL